MLLNSYKNPYLNLGCGTKIHGDWINIDFVSTSREVLKYNLLEKLPLNNNSIKYIYHSHLLEHFRAYEGRSFLQECYRLLQDGGIMRIVIPDLENIIRCYINLIDNRNKYSEPEFFKFHHWLVIELLDQTVREFPGGSMKESLQTDDPELLEFIWNRIGIQKPVENKSISLRKSLSFRIKRKLTKMLLTESEYKALNSGLFRNSGEIHKWMYDKYSLSGLLSDIGFKLIEIKDPYSSNIPYWEHYEFDITGNNILNPNSLYIEATK